MIFVHSSSFFWPGLAWDRFQHVAYHLLWVSKTFLGFSLRFTSWTTEFLFKIHSSYLQKKKKTRKGAGVGACWTARQSFICIFSASLFVSFFIFLSRTSLCWFSGLATYCLCFCNSVGIMRVFIYHASYTPPLLHSPLSAVAPNLHCSTVEKVV